MLKPVLKRDRKKARSNLNHSVPGFVYLMFDPRSKLTKIGLSRNPKKRRHYLAIEYQAKLKLLAMAPTLNMKVSEELMHHLFRRYHQYRTSGLDGFTEWFKAGYLTRIWMRILLFFVAGVTSLAFPFLLYKAICAPNKRRRE